MDFSANVTTKDAACFKRRRSCPPPRSSSLDMAAGLDRKPTTSIVAISDRRTRRPTH
jgi:hypothetical protein